MNEFEQSAKLGIKMPDSDLLKWYELIEEQEQSNLSMPKFSESKEINHKIFRNMSYRISFMKYSKPKLYKQRMELAKEFIKDGLSLRSYCKKFGVLRKDLSPAVNHYRYITRIEQLLKEESVTMETKKHQEYEENINFIPIETKKEELPINPVVNNQLSYNPDEVAFKNVLSELKIIFQEGISINIPSNIDTTKIIKIIDFLRGI